MKSKTDLKLKEDELWNSIGDEGDGDPVTRGQLDALGWLEGETDPITEEDVAVPTTDQELDNVIAILRKEKEDIAEYSFFGDPNWQVSDAQIEICEWAKGN